MKEETKDIRMDDHEKVEEVVEETTEEIETVMNEVADDNDIVEELEEV